VDADTNGDENEKLNFFSIRVPLLCAASESPSAVSPTGRGVVLLGLISRISRMLKIEQSVSLYVESKDDKR
jgi:hypothetical protein